MAPSSSPPPPSSRPRHRQQRHPPPPPLLLINTPNGYFGKRARAARALSVNSLAFGFIVCLQLALRLWPGRHKPAATPPVVLRSPSNTDHAVFVVDVSPVFKLPTRDWPETQFYRGHPVSEYRPSGQYYVADYGNNNPATMAIVTATRNPRPIFFSRTVRYVLEQSLQSFHWVIVNDHSTDPEAIRRLHQLRRWAQTHEPQRIVIVDRPPHGAGPNHGNGPAAMNYGLGFVGASPFVAILDDDDMWELTTLEKAALVMSWVPSAYAVSFDVVNHGYNEANEFMWRRGFHNGDENYHNENNLMQGTPFRAAVLKHCRFSEDMADGGADWDFWMCMASHGMWGLHVPENGNWYQWNPPQFREQRWGAVTSAKGLEGTHDRIKRRYPNLGQESAWPLMVLPPDDEDDDDDEDGGDDSELVARILPFSNPVGLAAGSATANAAAPPAGGGAATTFANKASLEHQSVLLVLRDLSSSPGTTLVANTALQAMMELAQQGWRVTVLITHYVNADGSEGGVGDATAGGAAVSAPGAVNQTLSHQLLLQSTHDVFVAGTIAPLRKLPDLVAYLLRSRGIELAIVMPDPSQLQISRRLFEAAAAQMMRLANEPLSGKTGLRQATDGRGITILDFDAVAACSALGGGEVGSQESTRSLPAVDCDRSSLVFLTKTQRDAMWYALASFAALALNRSAGASPSAAVDCLVDRFGYSAAADDDNDASKSAWQGAEMARSKSISDIARAASLLVSSSQRDSGRQPSAAAQTVDRGSAWNQFLRNNMDHRNEFGRSNRLREHGMDMWQIQRALQYRKRRRGIGRELQLACPEHVYADTKWFDALEDPRACAEVDSADPSDIHRESPMPPAEASDLRASAIQQCGAWCLANVGASQRVRRRGQQNGDDSVRIGWEFTGACFRPFPSLAAASANCRDVISAYLTAATWLV